MVVILEINLTSIIGLLKQEKRISLLKIQSSSLFREVTFITHRFEVISVSIDFAIGIQIEIANLFVSLHRCKKIL